MNRISPADGGAALPAGAWMVLSALAFSLMVVGVKQVGDRLPLAEVVLARALVSLALSYAMVRRIGVDPWGQRRGLLVVRGLVGSAALFCVYAAVVHLPLAAATVLQYLYPTFTALLAWLLLGERLGRRVLAAMGLGWLGVLLVARLAGRIVGHVEIVPRDLVVGSAVVRGAVLDRVAVLPECRGAGHGQRLVRAAEDRIRQSGAAVAFSRTRIAPSFHELGWSVLGRDSATPGRPTDILARLLEAPQRDGEPVTMRQWRHVELPAILRIYKQNVSRFIGPIDRSENYCRWLVSRGAFDSIIVALVGQDRYELHESSARIVGYCIQAGNRVLEIMSDPEFAGLEREILARVCAEAIENDRQEIVYESSAADPLHEAVAGGASLVQGGDRMIVAKVFRPLDVLSAQASAVAARVVAAEIKETVELGLDAPSFRGSIIVDAKEPREAAVHPGRVGRSYLRLSDDELGRLLLGQCDPVEAVAAGRMEPSTQMAQKLAGQLFPRTPLWCPMWDDLPA